MIRLPMLTTDHVYHVGQLDNKKRASYEGLALSVSWEPSRWHFINLASPVWRLERPGSTFLVSNELDTDARAGILAWGKREGIIELKDTWLLTDKFGMHYYSNTSRSERNDEDVTSRVPVEREAITGEIRAREHFLDGRGISAEWSCFTLFARYKQFDGAAQFERRSSPDRMDPLGCIFNLKTWHCIPNAVVPHEPTIAYASNGFCDIEDP